MINDIREYLFLTDRAQLTREFTLLSEKEKSEAGRRLNNLLVKVADGALVPLMHNTLKKNDVQKLVSLKGIPIDESWQDDIPWCKIDGMKKEEDIDELMQMADADIRDRERAHKNRAASLIQKTWRMHREKAAFHRIIKNFIIPLKIVPPWMIEVKVEKVNLKIIKIVGRPLRHEVVVYYHDDEHGVPIIDLSDELKEYVRKGRTTVEEIRIRI